jgi:hypothetical protein
MMRLRVLIMIEFLDNDWSHQINSIKMIHRQIKMCKWSELVLYRKTDHMTSFEYNSSRMIIIFAIVLSLIHDFRILSIMNSHISWHFSFEIEFDRHDVVRLSIMLSILLVFRVEIEMKIQNQNIVINEHFCDHSSYVLQRFFESSNVIDDVLTDDWNDDSQLDKQIV